MPYISDKLTTNLSLNILAVIVLADRRPGESALDQADTFRCKGDWQYVGIDRTSMNEDKIEVVGTESNNNDEGSNANDENFELESNMELDVFT